MSESKRKIFTGAQKAKIALEAVRGAKTINEISLDTYRLFKRTQSRDVWG